LIRKGDEANRKKKERDTKVRAAGNVAAKKRGERTDDLRKGNRPRKETTIHDSSSEKKSSICQKSEIDGGQLERAKTGRLKW